MSDIISAPSHYCYSKVEPKDTIRAWNLNFNLGNVIKYVVRAGRKDDILQDLHKAKQYLEFEIEYLEEELHGRTKEVPGVDEEEPEWHSR